MFADGLSLLSESQQVNSSLQDTSQYSGRSQLCSSLHGLHSSCYFQTLLSLLQSFGDCIKAPIIIGIYVTFMFHSFFNSLARSWDLSFFLLSFNFTLWSVGKEKSAILQILPFALINIKSGRLAENKWSVCMLKSHRSLYVLFHSTDVGLCIYHLFVSKFLHSSQWISLPTQSSLVLYFFYANLLQSLIMRLVVSSLSSHNLSLLFCCVLCIFALIWLVLMVLLCTAIRRDSVSFLRFPFHSHIHISSCKMLLTSHSKGP